MRTAEEFIKDVCPTIRDEVTVDDIRARDREVAEAVREAIVDRILHGYAGCGCPSDIGRLDLDAILAGEVDRG